MAKNNLTKALQKMVKSRVASKRADENTQNIDLQHSLMEKALNDLCGNYHIKGNMWETSLNGELRGLVIGGYGDPNSGWY